ncbi:MAG: geranylgeranylglycerol-phosphate geranylgeranyltransferase [Candidatus Ranarchaeia archaeon]
MGIENGSKFELKALWEIIRPANCIFGALTPVIALLSTVRFLLLPITDFDLMFLSLKSFIIYIFVAGLGNAINDIYDIEIDKINRPDRVLPRGAMSIKQTWIYVCILFLGALAISYTIHFAAIIGVIVFSFVGYFYATKAKIMGTLGNLFVATSFSFGLLYGSIVVSYYYGAPIISAPVFFYFITSSSIIYGREVIKGMEDVKGDKVRDVKTIALVYGPKKAAILAVISNTIGNIAFTLLWVFNLVGPLFIWFLIPGNIAVITSSIIIIKNPKDISAATKASKADKIGAYLGILSFLIGALDVNYWPLSIILSLLPL